jgi:cobalt transporter subunit CbtB
MDRAPAQPASLTQESRTGVMAPLLGAMLLGLVIVFGVGFSNIPVAHNAAHDVRHAVNFPCH